MIRTTTQSRLGLRPLSELHDEFAGRPGAEALLADAEEELAEYTNLKELRATL
ncbi:hypothetical protein [Candidatus Poriferisodalis sp.]|uniref:hypothetical protein n=1 Tax=Candidatus Poriferisodalis sp. TaxID=3101277 RepID=UPI003B023344